MAMTPFKNNIHRFLLPLKLWTPNFTYWWLVSLVTVFMFDLFWMGQTTFRPMSYFAFYPVLFLSAFILALPSLFFRNGTLQTIWLLFFDFLFIANLMYCRTYYNAIPLQSYGLVGNLKDFSASVVDSFKWYYIFLPILTLLSFIVFSLKKSRKTKSPSPFIYILNLIVLAIIIWVSDAWRGGIMKRMDFMANYAYLSSSITPIYSLGGFLVHDYYKTNEKLTPENVREVKDWLRQHEKNSKIYWEDSVRDNRKKPENLVLIFCESLESWPIGKIIEGNEITPNLNKWVNDSTTFYAPNVVTQVGSGRSIDAQLLILTGLRPMMNKAYAYEAIENKFFSIPDALKERNTRSYLFTCDKPYVWNQALVAKAFGIDTLIWAKDFRIDETAGPSKRLSDGSFMNQIVEKLEKGDIWKDGDKAMIMAVTYSGHNPFNLPKHLRKIDFKGDYPQIIKDYIVTANYTDGALDSLITYLKSRNDWGETMVVITGDHEGLASDRKEALANENSRKFVDPKQHTPLIILNSPIPGQYEEELGQTDLYTTILDLMGINDYPWYGTGKSIFDRDTFSLKENPSHSDSARYISDLILKFDLLRNYPDSIAGE